MSNEQFEKLMQELQKLNEKLDKITIHYPQECQHEYPNPWFATVPPCCTKCGKPAPIFNVTY